MKFRRDTASIIWLGLCLFLGLALFSFTPTDPSFNSTAVGHSLKVANYCGCFGSFLADLLLQGFGITAWFFVIVAGRMSIGSFLGEEISFRNVRFTWGILLLLTLASLLSLYFPTTALYDGQIQLGGWIGLVITNGLVKVFNTVGVSVILWCLGLVLIIYFTEKPLSALLRLPIIIFNIISSLSSKTSYRDKFRAMADNYEEGYKNIKNRIVNTLLFSSKKTLKVEEAKTIEHRPLRFKLEPELGSGRVEGNQEEETEDLPSETLEALSLDEASEEDVEEEETVVPTEKNKRKVKTKKKIQRKIANWTFPKMDLLDDPPKSRIKIDKAEIEKKAHLLVEKLAQFDVKGSIVDIKTGPAVSLFEFKPEADVPLSRITKLENDLSLALSSESVRIMAPIPGRDVVGIETSNSSREVVYLKDIFHQDTFWDEKYKLPLVLGKQVDGKSRVVDLGSIPHLLVAGSTGSGKSVFTVSAITGLLFRHSPKTLRLILIDPKQVDLAIFAKVPHLATPLISDMKKAVMALRWAVNEMEKRYRSLMKFGVRKLEEFNEVAAKLSAEEIKQHEINNEEFESAGNRNQTYYFTPQPYLLIVAEEFADLMSVDRQHVEAHVVRLAQKARAAGIHLFLAMQSPRKDVVTGLIKTNITGRISFKVASKTDSRIILDDNGGERLLAQGDMLYLAPGVSKAQRHHGPWVTDTEVIRILESH